MWGNFEIIIRRKFIVISFVNIFKSDSRKDF